MLIYELLKISNILSTETGTYRGTASLPLNFIDKSTGEESQIAVSAQLVEIEALEFFGLLVNMVRTSGFVGLIFGGVVGFPLIEDILKLVFKRRKKKVQSDINAALLANI